MYFTINILFISIIINIVHEYKILTSTEYNISILFYILLYLKLYDISTLILLYIISFNDEVILY